VVPSYNEETQVFLCSQIQEGTHGEDTARISEVLSQARAHPLDDKAFRLRMLYHPDNKSTGNEEMFNSSIRLPDLCPARRAAYDQERAAPAGRAFRSDNGWWARTGVAAS
jgi:hypothetical protein